MQRAQRAVDNPALDAAVRAANDMRLPVVAFLAPVPFYPRATERHVHFLLTGADDIARGLARRGVGLAFRPFPEHDLERFCDTVGAALVIGDENPLRETEAWRLRAAERLAAPLVTVDADVVVPSATFPAQEYMARTIRPKIHRVIERFLVDEPEPRARIAWGSASDTPPADPNAILARWPIDRSSAPVPGARGGTRAARATLRRFLRGALASYDEARNHPELAHATSGLSPYLHFGHIGPREIARAVLATHAPPACRDAFLEQLIVRRELAVNFVSRNAAYDSAACYPRWAQATLARHATDGRLASYDDDTLEHGRTDDALWNAAQHEMTRTGFMHGYVRMYWAKRLLEWSPTAAVAHERAVRWNDRYELDGRDPNGYANIAWALGGVHDRPWPERPIFGTVRYMNERGMRRKFDVNAYIARVGGQP